MKEIDLSRHYEIGDGQTPLEKIKIRSGKLPDDEACLVPVSELREYAAEITALTARVAELEEAKKHWKELAQQYRQCAEEYKQLVESKKA